MRGFIITVAMLAAAGLGTEARAAPARKSAAQPNVAAIARTLDCSKHRFEATIHLAGPDGKLADKTVRMCGAKGESDGDWIATLNDAAKKTADNPQMPAAAKEQIVSAVKAEIARLSSLGLDLPPGGDISRLAGKGPVAPAPSAPLARDYNALPPLPTASSVAPPNLLGPGGSLADAAHLTLRCAVVGDEDRPESCQTIDRDTVLVVRADEAYAKGVAMRFVRGGASRGEVVLPALRAGDTRTVRLPATVCSGVVRAKLEIQARSTSSPDTAAAGSIGEYDLRC